MGGGFALSVCLLQDVTGKIGKAFNVMQYLSNHPIKIRPSQSLPADQACTTHSLHAAEPPYCRCASCSPQKVSRVLLHCLLLMQLGVGLFSCARDEESMFQLRFGHH